MTTPTRPLRCTIVTAHASLGGSERWLLSILAHGPRLQATIVLLQDGPLRPRLAELGVDVTVLPTGPSGLAVARTARALAAHLRQADPEVVLANGIKAAAATVPAARLAGVPVVWAKHDFSFDSTVAPWLARASDAVLATSEAVAEAARDGAVTLVPPPRPALAQVSKADARELWRAGGTPLPDGPVLAMVGRLVPYKGIDTAIRALPMAPSWHLVVVGGEDPAEPGEGRRLRALAAHLDVDRRVHLIGEMEGVDRALVAVDAVAVLTRRVGRAGREGYSIVGLEALAADVPLIGAEGNPEVVRMAAAGGRVVPTDDAAAVAEALATLSREQGVPDAGRRLVADHPDADRVADRVSALLAETALRPGAGLSGPPMTVLTCFRNEMGHIDGVVDSVRRQLRHDDEYLLVDDHSEDGTTEELRAWAEQDSRLRVLTGLGINLSAARNHGFESARHAHVACTDAGVTQAPGWLDHLRAPFAEERAVDLVVGTFDVDGGTPTKEASRLALFPDPEHTRRGTPFRRARARVLGRSFSVDRLDGRSMACRVDAWRRAGGFDVALFSSEDAVFGEAVRRTGGRAVLSLAARVVWEQPDSFREMATTFSKYGYWGGRAGSAPLVAKDMTRILALASLLGLSVWGGRTGRRTALLVTGTYLGLPMGGAVAAGHPLAVTARIPAVLLLKDLSKSVGCARGLAALALRRSPSARG